MLELLLMVIGACGVAASIVVKVVYRRCSGAAESSPDAGSVSKGQLLSKPGRAETEGSGFDSR